MLKAISSMATRQVLADLLAAWEQGGGIKVAMESVGGVDAAKRVQADEAFDIVVLASDAIDKLEAAGKVRAGSRVDLVRSGVVACVPAGAVKPDISTEDGLRQAVQAAPTIGYSTGPSGVALIKLFERWGIAQEVAQRTVQAPPGVPVGSLVAKGEVALGFQQYSELIHLTGIDLLGPLPDAVQITTIFSAGICASSSDPDTARGLIAFLASPEAAEAKRRQGMDPA